MLDARPGAACESWGARGHLTSAEDVGSSSESSRPNFSAIERAAVAATHHLMPKAIYIRA